MTFHLIDGWLRLYNSSGEVARCQLVETDTLVCVGRLSVDPSAPYGTFLRVCREVLRYTGERKMRIVVDAGPNMERLVRTYARLGGQLTGVVMEN